MRFHSLCFCYVVCVQCRQSKQISALFEGPKPDANNVLHSKYRAIYLADDHLILSQSCAEILTTMTSLCYLQTRLAAIFAEATAQGINAQNIIPPEVEVHFGNLLELKSAKEYIKETEEREVILKNEKAELAKELKHAKQFIQNPLDEVKQLEQDLALARNQIDFYKHLSQSAEERAAGYQQKWQEALKKQGKIDDSQRKIQRLESACTDLKTLVLRLDNENKSLKESIEQVQAQHLRALEDKETKLMKMEHKLKEETEQYRKSEEEADIFQETYSSLVETLQDESHDVATALNKASGRFHATDMMLQKAEQLRNATVSELKPLRRCYDHCHDVLQIYQDIFCQLLNTEDRIVVQLPDTLRALLESARTEIETYTVMNDAMGAEYAEDDDLRVEIASLAVSAIEMQGALEAIGRDVERFLMTLERRPEFWILLRAKFKVPTPRRRHIQR